MYEMTAMLPQQHDGLSLIYAHYAPLEYQSPHSHDTANITLIRSGALVERSAAYVTRANAFSVVVKPQYCVHADDFGPAGAQTLQLRLSPELARLFTRFMDYRWIPNGEAGRAMAAFLSDPAPDSLRIWNGFIDVLGALPVPAAMKERGVPDRKLRDLAARISESPGEGLSVREVAAQLGMHPVSLARAFRRQHGFSITGYIRRARILHACRLMHDRSLSLTAIALETGFADQAHLTRAFCAETGLPPGAFRKQARPGAGR